MGGLRVEVWPGGHDSIKVDDRGIAGIALSHTAWVVRGVLLLAAVQGVKFGFIRWSCPLEWCSLCG